MSLRDAMCLSTHERALRRAGNAGLQAFRDELLAAASGHVLEVGARAGANLPRYGTGIETLTVTEWRPAMFRRLARRSDEQTQKTTALRAPVEDLPFNDATFDVVVSTFALCRADDQPRALREIHRVLRPAGALMFIEHGRPSNRPFTTWQDRIHNVRRYVLGCDDTRPTVDSIRAAGFEVTDLRIVAGPLVDRALPYVVGLATPIPGRRYGACHPAAAHHSG